MVFIVKKWCFPIAANVVSCTTRTKNLEWYLNLCIPTHQFQLCWASYISIFLDNSKDKKVLHQFMASQCLMRFHIQICNVRSVYVSTLSEPSEVTMFSELCSPQYTVLHIFRQVLFGAVNQDNHQNFDPSLLAYKCWLIFMVMKQKNFFCKLLSFWLKSKKLTFSTSPILIFFEFFFQGLVF